MSYSVRLIVGISGASGIIYGIRTLVLLKKCNVESHLIVSRNALIVLQQEIGMSKSSLYKLADKVYSFRDVGASISSGSCKNHGMLITPCSIHTMSEIASGVTSSLMSRAADVALKEKRRLVLMVRETPLHLGHLRTMLSLTEMGAVIMPPVPAYYMYPKNIDDIINYTIVRALNLFGIHSVNSIKNVSWSGIVQSNRCYPKKK